MPDVVMPMTIERTLAALNARVQRLETYGNAAQNGTVVPVGKTMTLLGQAIAAGSGGNCTRMPGRRSAVAPDCSSCVSRFIVHGANCADGDDLYSMPWRSESSAGRVCLH